MTDDSPRSREAFRYMVYGKANSFDVVRMIDMLQALEKFVSVKDLGDGTAFKKDGMRGYFITLTSQQTTKQTNQQTNHNVIL